LIEVVQQTHVITFPVPLVELLHPLTGVFHTIITES
jgi:hypothetical protein